MARLRPTLIALLLAAAAVSGLRGTLRTVPLGATAATVRTITVPARELAARRTRLLRWSRSLAQERAKRPPALPRLPQPPAIPAPAPVPVAAPAGAQPAAPPVRYVQPPPVVRYAKPPPTAARPSESWSDDGSDDGSQESDDGSGGD